MVAHQDSSVWSQLTLHLHQELGLDATRGLALVLVPGAAQRVHLIDEDDGGLLLAGQVKQVLHQSGRNKQARTKVITSAQRMLERKETNSIRKLQEI